jgi:M6 family metalloprotease-like protein
MKRSGFLSIAVLLALLVHLVTVARGQSWLDFAHPNNPHLDMNSPDVPITVPELLQGTGDVTIQLPVLLILMDFSDVAHRADHPAAFWEDLVFGNPRAGPRSSVAQIYRENTNGRLLLVPALAGDWHDGRLDGVVGWIAHTETYGNLYQDVKRKRAEGIRIADPLFDYHVYDNNNDGLITSDELLVLVVTPDTGCCDQHHQTLGHVDPAGCDPRCSGGNTRPTDPSQVDVDQDTNWPKKVYQHVAGMAEMTHVNVVAHEIGHSRFGLGDLYPIDWDACQIHIQMTDGDFCRFCNNCNDHCGNATCMEDGLPASGNTNAATGTDVTTCALNDNKDIWFTYTPASTGWVTVSLCGSDYDTTLAVFDGCSGNQIDCNDDFDCDGDGSNELQSQLSLWLTSATTYWIRVAGFNDATGKYALTVTGGGGDCGYANDKSNWYPPHPGNFSLMALYWVDYVPHLDPWAKIHLGLVKPVVVTRDGTYSLHAAETVRNFSAQSNQPEALIIYDPLRTDPYNEYFILENRDQGLLNDQGVAVWLINENTNNRRKVVRLIRRGGHFATDGQALWDGVNNMDGYDLTATSIPRNTSWTDGSSSYIEVYDISQAGSSMTFKVTMPPLFVDQAHTTGSENGSQANPFDTVGEGVSAVPEPPRTIKIAGGSYPETVVISTPCTLRGWRNGNAFIGQ